MVANHDKNDQVFRIRSSYRAFTLTELVITVLIISMIAAFAIPNYQKAVRRTYERNAILHLTTIHGANEIYKARNDVYVPGAGLNLAGINNALSISIMDNNMTYSYTFDGATIAYAATAAWGGGNNFTVRVNQNSISAGNPCCSAGSCPSLPACP